MPAGFEGFDFGGGGGGGRTFHFSTGGGGPGGSGFSFTNPEDIFAEFMRGGNMRGFGGGGGMEDDGASYGFPGSGGRSSRMRTGGERRRRDPSPEVVSVERPLPVSLEEMFSGVKKRMKITAKTFDPSGKQVMKDNILEVPIKAGLKKGSKIKFKGVGDQVEGGRQDLHFVVDEVRDLKLPLLRLQRGN